MHEGGRLVYDGRCDRQIKRLGHRINLDHIQQVCSMCEGRREGGRGTKINDALIAFSPRLY